MTECVAIGGATVTALLDSEGPFFLPLSEAFPSAGPEVLESAQLLGARLGTAHLHSAFIAI